MQTFQVHKHSDSQVRTFNLKGMEIVIACLRLFCGMGGNNKKKGSEQSDWTKFVGVTL